MHLQYIVWAYAGVAVVTLALIAYVALDARAVQRRLAALDKAGIRRRSAGTGN
ncbi:MAG: heme exporter protein CcmD [Devosia sp.]|nr:heme exporter protein CcmD [Devosia sp.]